MTEERESANDEADELPYAWKQVQTAIWLIGLAILAWQGWWWPGILVLVAISVLTEAALRQYAARQEQAARERAREVEAALLLPTIVPDACPNCGGLLSVEVVDWKSENRAACPYCGSIVTKNVS